MTPTQAIHALLAADATLAALAPGGVHRAVPEITRQLVPAAFDATTRELKTCVLVKPSSETVDGPARRGAAQLVNVWVYDRADDARVEAVLARVRAVLHRTYLGGGMYEASYFDTTFGWRDDALAARGGVARYEVTIYRG